MALPLWFRPQARRDLLDLPRPVQARIIEHLEQLAADPTTPGLQRLKGRWRSFSKLRVGDYRVILRVEPERLHVATLGHRSSVYEKLKHSAPDHAE